MHVQPQLHPQDEWNQRLLAHLHPAEWQNPTPADRYNLVVIGGGSAGLVAAAGAAGLGARVALVERHLLGGDCLNVGCVPSKAVIRSARVMGELRRADRFGIHVNGNTHIEFGEVMRHMRRARAHLSPHDSARRFTELGVDVFFGEARFTDTDAIAVNGDTLRFRKALIATGSRPMQLPIEGLAATGYLTNETVFQLTERPPRLAVIGAGPIGCELAQSFQRLGSQVTLLEIMPKILIREDIDAAAIVAQALEADGIDILTGVQIQRIEKQGDVKCIFYARDDVLHELAVDEILLGAGRVPNIESLNLEAAGGEYHKKGVVVDDTLRTTNPNVYAAGDVALKYQFTHTADASARLVLQNALFPGPKKKIGDLIVPWVTYTDPEIGHVGLYPHEAEEQGLEIDTYTVQMNEVDRAVADGATEGFLKMHTKKGSDQILGATVVADHAGEMISEITLAMQGGLGLKTIADTIHPYPVQAAAIRMAADQYNRTRLTPLVGKLFSAWFSWNR